MMNCQKTEEVINELAREQMLETSVRDAALAHCAMCSDCGKRLHEQRALTALLRGLAQNMRSVEAAPIVSANLSEALRARVVAPAASTRHYRRIYVAVGVAAILLVFFVLGVLSLNLRPASERLPNTANSPITPSPEVALSKALPEPFSTIEAVNETKHRSSPRRIKHSSRSAAARTSTVATPAIDHHSEIATEFFPLGYGNALNLQDGGQIVRMEVPRSTMFSFGLPINMDRASERIKADLLVGADGSARAIRFVH